MTLMTVYITQEGALFNDRGYTVITGALDIHCSVKYNCLYKLGIQATVHNFLIVNPQEIY